MQALRNKFHGRSRRNSKGAAEPEPVVSSRIVQEPVGVTSFSESHQDLPSGQHVDTYQKTEVIPAVSSTLVEDRSIPIPPPLPPADFWNVVEDTSKYDAIFAIQEEMIYPKESTQVFQTLPTEVIEKDVIIHENIRREQVEEIQRVVKVEREKTEVRQIIQPLVDKEIKPVLIEDIILPTEVLPTITQDTLSTRREIDHSTREFDNTMRQVIEKAPIINESEKWRVIEEVQPIIYREVIIPHIIKTTIPMREVVVEAPMFAEQMYQTRELTLAEREKYASYLSKETILREEISAVPIAVIPEPTITRSVPAIIPVAHKKEVVEEVTTTTTTTTVAPVVGLAKSGNLRSSNAQLNNFQAGTGKPVVLAKSHNETFGSMGEKIVKDTITTTTYSQNVMPTRAN